MSDPGTLSGAAKRQSRRARAARLRGALFVFLALAACTTRGPTAMSQAQLKARGTHAFDGQFEDVYDAAYLALERFEGHISMADRIQGVFENDKVQFSPPPGWDGDAFRSYAVSVYQDGSRVAVSAVPRLWAGDRDVSDEPLWELTGMDGEDAHWEHLFDNIQALLEAWRDVPTLKLEPTRAEVSVLGVHFLAPADFKSVELTPDGHQVIASREVHPGGCPGCPGGLNPTIVFEIDRRHPAPDAPRLERAALEHALGPNVVEPEAWATEDGPTGKKGSGQAVAGETGKTTSVVWHVWDAGELAWMVRAAAACGPPEGPAGCDLAWDAMINGVVTEAHR